MPSTCTDPLAMPAQRRLSHVEPAVGALEALAREVEVDGPGLDEDAEPTVPGVLQHPQRTLGGNVDRVYRRASGLGHGDSAVRGHHLADHGTAVREVLERSAPGGR